MSFWNTSEGEKVKSAENIELDGGGDFLPIPAGTDVKVAAEETKWDTTDRDGTFISIKWQVLAPAIYKGRKIFQKLKVLDEVKKTKDKALRMFGVIATNAGGELLKSDDKPTDDTLTKNITNKIMVLKLDVWELDKDDNGDIIPKADRKSGNWVKGIAAKAAYVEPSKEDQAAALQKQQEQHKAALSKAPETRATGGGGGGNTPAPSFDSFDDDIPF